MSAVTRFAVASLLFAGLATAPVSAAVFQRGDANADGTVNISDAITVLGFLFLGSPAALQCEDAADVDDSGALNITDPVYLLGFLFLGGPAPPAPFGKCGSDPTADALACAAFPPCPQKPGILEPPVLDPLPAPAVAAGTIVLAGSAAADAAIEVAGGARLARGAADASGRFAIEVELLPNRLNRLFATAVDGGRRSAPASAEVIHDAERPLVFIDEPREGERLIGEEVVITGRVSDRLTGALDLEVSIDGRPANVVIGIGTNGTYALRCPLVLGENLFTVTVRDIARNEAEASVRVVRESPEGTEHIEVVSGGGQTAAIARPLPEPIVVRRISAAGAPVAGADVTFEVVRSDGILSTVPEFQVTARTIRARSDAEGRARVYWRLGTDAGCGNNRLEVNAKGVSLRTVVCASARPGPAAQINVGSGQNQRVEAGAPAPERLRAWVSDSCNGLAGVPVTFTVTHGTGRVNGASSITVPTGATGHAAVDLVLGPEAGNQAVEAQFEGNKTAPAVFTLFGVLRREDMPTTFHGLVLDNASQPIGGARCTLRLQNATILETHSDLEGQFRFEGLPAAGLADLFVDGLVATAVAGVAVKPGSFPFLHYEPVLVPNAENSLGTPVLLPRLDPRNARTYSTTEDTILEVEGVEGLKKTIKPGSMRLPVGPDLREGTPAPEGTIVALNQVHHDQVPMPMPDGAAPPFAWTLQPAGATFDPPITIEYPNMSGLAAGAVAYFLSFDHDTGRFEIVASGHVTEDGSTIVTDPGVGLTLAGWGCNCPPYSVAANAKNCCRVAVALFQGGPRFLTLSAGAGLRRLRAALLAAGDGRVFARVFGSRNDENDQLMPAMRWLEGLAIEGCPPPRVMLIGHSLGGDTVRLSGAIAAGRRIAIDPIERERALQLPNRCVYYQRDFEPLAGAGGITNFLAENLGKKELEDCREPGCRLSDSCLRGYFIAQADNRVLGGTDHSTVVDDAEVREESVGQVRSWLGDGAGGGAPAEVFLDEAFQLTAGGQTIQVEEDGSYRIPNIPAPDLFGPGGPGTAPDFQSDDPVRVLGRATIAGKTWYAWSEPFRIRQGETAIIGDLTISEEPPPLPERIALTLPATTLGAGETAQLTVTGTLGEFFGGAEVDVTTRERGTTYRTSSPAIAMVDELGVLTAHAPGRAFITATNEGASAVRRVDVVSDLVRVTVSGRLLLPGGSPAAGAVVTGPRGQSTAAAADGRFSLVLSLGRKETAQLRIQLVVEGERFGAAVALGAPKDGAALDLGDLTLQLLIEGFDPIGENEQGYPEYGHLATGLIFVLLPGGTFLMGSPADEPGRDSDEGPVHEVELSPFLISKYEVTQEVWEPVMGSNPSWFRGRTLPVERVSWNDAQAFCQAAGLKLPTEAQWEYAARAGTRTAFYNGPITQLSCTPLDPLLDAIAWYCGNSGNRTHPAGEKAPNGFGLHDMSGNVYEWCEDVYDSGFYSRPEATMKDPLATTASGIRVIRGGSWLNFAQSCRSALRCWYSPSVRDSYLGFRPVFSPLP
jgi:formylglycine-generating enzyme required for sulfatase activity